MTAPQERDLSIGAQIPDRTFQVRAEAMKIFSLLTDDPNPIHWDVEAVTARGLGDRPVNQGGLNAGYVLQAITAWAGGPEALRRADVRFLGSVFAGDTVVAGGEIVDVRPTSDGRADVSLSIWLRSSTGVGVIAGSAVVAVPASTPTGGNA
jgi:acyl dehydratase